MEDDSALEDLSLLPRGAVIPRGETWQGSPARDPSPVAASRQSAANSGTADSGALPRRRYGQPRRAASPSAFCTRSACLIFPVLVVAALFPGIVVMNKLNYLDPYYWYLLLAPLVGLSFIVLLALEIAVAEMAPAGQGEARAVTRCTASTTCANGLWTRPGPEPRHPGAALRLRLSDALVPAPGRQTRLRRRGFHRLLHLARPAVHRRRELHCRQRLARRARECATAS